MTSASIIKLSDVFLVTFQGELSDRDALTLREDLAKRVSGTGARGVLIDVSGHRATAGMESRPTLCRLLA